MNSLKPGISMKRKADDDPSSSSSFNHTKVIKTEKLDSSPNYSQDVKKKISASARTGQACDRCRVSPSIDTVYSAASITNSWALGSQDALR